MTALHDELVVTIDTVRPYGYLVRLPDGTAGLIDIAKTPSWKARQPAPVVGDEFLVAVVDDSRTPWRLSALAEDIEIARSLRGNSEN